MEASETFLGKCLTSRVQRSNVLSWATLTSFPRIFKIERWGILQVIDTRRTFKRFSYARFTTGPTFQQANRPMGVMQEDKEYFTRKHKLYSYEVEVSVPPIGIAVSCCSHYPASVSDVDIFHDMIDFHRTALKQTGGDNDVSDIRFFIDNYLDEWAVLADKEYQGGAEFLRTITPHKKPRKRDLSAVDEAFNRKVSRDRIIAESLSGRMCVL